MNPLFSGMRMPVNPMQKIGQAIRDVQMLQRNPEKMGQYLADHGVIGRDQVDEISRMGNPSQIGQYLIQNGIMPQQETQEAYQNIVPIVQNNLK